VIWPAIAERVFAWVEQPLSRTTRRIETLLLWRTPAEASKAYGAASSPLVTATARASDGRHLAQGPVTADRRSQLSRARARRYRYGVETRVSLAMGVRGVAEISPAEIS
jgi:hypothetical protein